MFNLVCIFMFPFCSRHFITLPFRKNNQNDNHGFHVKHLDLDIATANKTSTISSLAPSVCPSLPLRPYPSPSLSLTYSLPPSLSLSLYFSRATYQIQQCFAHIVQDTMNSIFYSHSWLRLSPNFSRKQIVEFATPK